MKGLRRKEANEVTKEAKIGLLLGLVFIVAIAVVLRGVHQGTPADLDETLMLGQNRVESGSIGRTEPENLSVAVQQLSVAPGLRSTENPTAAQPVIQPAAHSPARPSGEMYGGDIQRDESNVAALDTTSAARPLDEAKPLFVRPLPRQCAAQAAREGQAIIPPSGIVERAVANVDIPVANQTSPMVNANETSAQRTAATIRRQRRFIYYRVVKGDDLSGIAKKVYGDQEGNRWVNIKKIYEANREHMASMDELRVGQKLVIPAIEGIELKPVTTTNRHTTGGRSAQVSKQRPRSASSGGAQRHSTTKAVRMYVVQAGDSLWKIAERKLGNGRRFAEIARLNHTLLSNENNLRPGMRLRLPRK